MRFELIMPHYMMDAYLEAGTIIGDGTRWFPIPKRPDGSPALSMNMTPLDDEAKKAMEAHGDKWADKGGPPIEIQQIPRNIIPGQRPGGEGPKPSGDQILHPPGQGPRDGAGHQVVEHPQASPNVSTGGAAAAIPAGATTEPKKPFQPAKLPEPKLEKPNEESYPKG